MLSQIQGQKWQYAQPRLFELENSTNEEEWSLVSKVVAQEEILGASVDAHPLELVADRLRGLDITSTLEALNHPEEEIQVAGIRQTVQRFHTQEGSFYILELDDLQGVLPVRMTPEFYRYHQRWLSTREPFVVRGKMGKLVSTREEVLISQKLYPLNRPIL
jgi:DNA polymerase III alpha subunit